MNIFCQQGDKLCLAELSAIPLVKVLLFQNNYIPLITDTEANYVEATFSGYPMGGYALAWGAPFVNGAGKGEIDATPQAFTNTTGAVGNTIYGAYVVDAFGKLVYADRFGAPVVMASAGNTFTYTPIVTAVTG